MRNRVYRYLLLDHGVRWRNDLLCMIAAFAWATFQVAVSSLSERDAFIQSLVVLVVGMTITALWYALVKQDDVSAVSGTALSRRNMVGQLKHLGYASLAVVAMALPLPQL